MMDKKSTTAPEGDRLEHKQKRDRAQAEPLQHRPFEGALSRLPDAEPLHRPRKPDDLRK